MAIQFVGQASAGNASATVTISLTSLTGGIDTAARTGDLVIVAGGKTTQAAVDADMGPVSPYTYQYFEVADLFANDTLEANFSVAYKFMRATPDTEVTVTGGSTNVAMVRVYRGVDFSSPLDAITTTAVGTNSSLANPPAITPLTAGVLIETLSLASSSAASGATFTTPAGLSNGFSVKQDGTGGLPDAVVSAASYDAWVSGSYDPAAWTGGWSTTDDGWASVTMALRPSGVYGTDDIIDEALSSSQVQSRAYRSVVFTTASIGYAFMTSVSLSYRKTTDGGSTWGAPVTISTNSPSSLDVWFDQWTPGDTGSLIHIWSFDNVDDDPFYITLNTTSDTLGTKRTIANLTNAGGSRTTAISGTKTRSGYLYAAYVMDGVTERGLSRSTDGGVTWSLLGTASTFMEAATHQALLFPASNTGDDNDCWAIYHDRVANALTLKMWDSSAAAVVESATIVAHTPNTTAVVGQNGFSASLRHADGHLILAAVDTYDAASSHTVHDITGTGAFTALTSIASTTDDHYHPAVFIDQTTNDILVAYNGKRDGSEDLGAYSKVYYTISTDGGATWSAGDTAYMQSGVTSVAQVWVPPMGPRFLPVWRYNGSLQANVANSLTTFPASTGGVGYSPGSSRPVVFVCT